MCDGPDEGTGFMRGASVPHSARRSSGATGPSVGTLDYKGVPENIDSSLDACVWGI